MGNALTFRVRGLVPSLGAGGSLVVAALCCLLLATAFISFRDWPGRGEATSGGTITMPAPPAKAAGRAASGPSSPAAAAAAVPVTERAARRAPARRGSARRAPAAPQVPAGTSPPAAPAPSAPVAAPAPAASQPAASAPATPVADPQQPAGEPGRVERLVEDIRKNTEPLPPVVKEPVQPVLDAVQDVGQTVDDVTGPLLPTLP
jgi:hypothetical protein